MKKKSYILFVLILATICLCACGKKESSEKHADKQMEVYITTDTGCYSTTLEDIK